MSAKFLLSKENHVSSTRQRRSKVKREAIHERLQNPPRGKTHMPNASAMTRRDSCSVNEPPTIHPAPSRKITSFPTRKKCSRRANGILRRNCMRAGMQACNSLRRLTTWPRQSKSARKLQRNICAPREAPLGPNITRNAQTKRCSLMAKLTSVSHQGMPHGTPLRTLARSTVGIR